MSEVVSNDTYRLSQEDENILKEVLNFLFEKIKQAQIKTDERVVIQVGSSKNRYQTTLHKEPSLNDLEPKEIKQIRAALQNPSALKGRVGIFVGDDLDSVYEVENGRLITDSLKLSSGLGQEKFQVVELKLNPDSTEVGGQKLAQQAREMLAYVGRYNETSNSVDFESGYYMFRVKNKQLSVSSKLENKEVLNDKGFTEQATSEDIKALQNIEGFVEQLKAENKLTPPSFNLSR